jgi:hypothetical protein
MVEVMAVQAVLLTMQVVVGILVQAVVVLLDIVVMGGMDMMANLQVLSEMERLEPAVVVVAVLVDRVIMVV